MAEQTHFGAFVDHIVGDDDSELGKIKAERDYALHCLEREIAICSQTQAHNDVLVKALQATQGQIINANIDLLTGHTKAQVAKKMDGIVRFVDAALASAAEA